MSDVWRVPDPSEGTAPSSGGSPELSLDPDQAFAGARDLRLAGEQLEALHRGEASELASASATPPWGADAYGSSFERQYRPVEHQVLEAWSQLAAHLADLGGAAHRSVLDNLDADADAARRFRRRP